MVADPAVGLSSNVSSASVSVTVDQIPYRTASSTPHETPTTTDSDRIVVQHIASDSTSHQIDDNVQLEDSTTEPRIRDEREDSQEDSREDSRHTHVPRSDHDVDTRDVNVTTVATTTVTTTPTQQSSDDFVSPTRKRPASSLDDDEDEDEESYTCPICFEAWSTSGRHRVVSLKCGHLFGKECIERWLKGRGEKCPQCNAAAKKSDLRPIFTRVVRAVDTDSAESALRDLEKERQEKQRAQQAEAKARIELQILKKQYEKLKQQLRINANTASVAREAVPETASAAAASDGDADVSDKRYVLTDTIQIPQRGCRVLAYDRRNAMLLASAENTKPTPFSPAGAGIVKVSTLALGRTEYVGLHRKAIRDMRAHPDGSGILLTVSLDKTAKLTSLHSNAVVCTYTLPAPAWTACWHSDVPHTFFCGLTNNTVCEFDVRNTRECVRSLAVAPVQPKPVVALHHMARRHGLSLQGLLVTTLGGTAYLSDDAMNVVSTSASATDIAALSGSCTWCHPHRPSGNVVASFRPSRTHASVAHVVATLGGLVGGDTGGATDTTSPRSAELSASVTCGVQRVLQGPTTQKSLTRSRLVCRPDAPDVLHVCAGDETALSARIYDVDGGDVVQTLPCMGQTCMDMCALGAEGTVEQRLAVLTDNRVLIHAWR